MTLLFTCIAMIAFAANSLLARAALSAGAIDGVSFTAVRLVAGAVTLVVLLRFQRRGSYFDAAGGSRRDDAAFGSWASGFALFAYAIAFSLAYLRLGAATGALILFSSVQFSMIAWGLLHGHRPIVREVAGLVIAAVAFAWLLAPGAATPDLAGAVLMTASGIAWGVYSLRGRGSRNPLADTAGNFVRAVPFGLLMLVLSASAFAGPELTGLKLTGRGTVLAIVSGAVTSGLGYAIWYRALPSLSPMHAATVQLTVPILAALGAVAFLSETLTLRLVVASVVILGGVAVSILSRQSRSGRA